MDFTNTTFPGAQALWYHNSTTLTVTGFKCAVPKRSRSVAITTANIQHRVINTRTEITVTSTGLAHDLRSIVINGTGGFSAQGVAYPIESLATLKITVDAELDS